MNSITLLIIDESGSMAGMESYVNETYLGIVNQIKREISESPELIQFIEVWTFEGSNIQQRIPFMQLTESLVPDNLNYQPGMSTPLFDAVGISVSGMKSRLKSVESLREAQVNVSIITDGLENSSVEYTAYQLAKLIEELKQKEWNFSYYGTNHDVFTAAKEISIDDVKAFEKSAKGFRNNAKRMVAYSYANKMEYINKLKKK